VNSPSIAADPVVDCHECSAGVRPAET
jgi:hypothetical protein